MNTKKIKGPYRNNPFKKGQRVWARIRIWKDGGEWVQGLVQDLGCKACLVYPHQGCHWVQIEDIKTDEEYAKMIMAL